MRREAVLLSRFAACALACSALSAGAVDGIVLVDQNRAIAGAVTPSDFPGFPISINQPGSYRLSGNLTVPPGSSGIEINVDNVTIDLNGFSIVGPGSFPNGSFAGVAATGHQRITVSNGKVSGFVFGLSFTGDSRLITLDKLTVDATTRLADNTPIGGIGALIGRTRSSYAVVSDFTAIGQVQIACPGLVRNSIASIIETKVPFDGSGVSFPANCRGDNVLPAPSN